MRKIIVTTVILSIVFSLFSCSANESSSQSPTTPATSDATLSTQPTQPQDPTQPAQPSQPQQPDEPSSPSNPTQPQPSQPTDPEGTNPGEGVEIQQKDIYALSLVPVISKTTAQDGTVIFTETHQEALLFLPEAGVASKILLDLNTRLTPNEDDIEDAIDMAQLTYRENSANWIPHLKTITYTPMRFDSGVLSLMGVDITRPGTAGYTGKSVSYDLLTGGTLALTDILCENISASMLTPLIIQALESGSYNLYDYYESTITASMNAEAAGIKNWYFTENGLCFYYNPYDIGPYVSGIITAEIPYSKLVTILRDAYFPAEMDTVSGTITSAPFTSDVLGNFTQFAELILDDQGTRFLLYTDKSVVNLQIHVRDKGMVTTGGLDGSTVAFRIYTLTPGDAVTVAVDFSTTDMLISYQSGIETIVKTVTLNDGEITFT